MADETRYFRGVDGVTDGLSHYGTGDVFVGSPDVVAFFDRDSGKFGDRQLIEEVDKAAYDEFRGVDVDLVSRGDVVGTLPTGEDSLLDTQKGADGEPLAASTDPAPEAVDAPDTTVEPNGTETEEPAPKTRKSASS